MSTADDLRAAAEVINRLGWQRGLFQRWNNGPVCIMGAVCCAILGKGTVGTPFAAQAGTEGLLRWKYAHEALTDALGTSPITWNDEVARDADDAVHVLKETAEKIDRWEEYRVRLK
jgi:hypothetical protein